MADREIIIRLNGTKHASAASRVARAFSRVARVSGLVFL